MGYFLVILGGPLVAIMVGIVGYVTFKSIFIAPAIVAVITLILSFTVFNTSFLIWVVIYTLLAFISGFLISYNKRKNGN